MSDREPWSKWPTAEEMHTRSPLTREQQARFGHLLEHKARMLAAVICENCDMVKQQIHVPVYSFLQLLDLAAAWSPEPVDNQAEDPAGPPDVPAG